jgi:malonyl CoA-acyl carrier protein transacylase
MFPGQGAQYLGMGRQLFKEEPLFRATIEACLSQLADRHDLDLRPLFAQEGEPCAGFDAEAIAQTRVAQPYLFAVEYALARLLISWGVKPNYVIGHSVGEFAAACIAGVFSLEDALALVALRGQLMQAIEPGAMLSVTAAAESIALPPDLDVAALNGPRQTVVSGPVQHVEAFAADLAAQDIPAVRPRTSHAFHSRMMVPTLEVFGRAVEACPRRPPAFPLISNLTGGVVLWETLREPQYWTRHIREPVRFADGLQTLLVRGVDVAIEVGPGRQLTTLAQQNGLHRQQVRLLTTLQGEGALASESNLVARTLSRLWLEGVRVDWAAVHQPERRRVISLPAYPFEHESFRTEPVRTGPIPRKGKLEVAAWRYVPSWRRTQLVPLEAAPDGRDCWLVFENDGATGLAERLRQSGRTVVSVLCGSGFAKRGRGDFVADPNSALDYLATFENLKARGRIPRKIVHAWTLAPATSREREGPGAEDRALFDERQARGAQSLARALAAHKQVFGREPVAFEIVTSGTQDLTGDDVLRPSTAAVTAFAHVAPQENTHVSCRVIDIDPQLLEGSARRRTIARIEGALASASDQTIALRGRHYWWARGVDALTGAPGGASGPLLKRGGVYLITGGMGYVGLVLARHLAERWNARLVLVGRSPLDPPPTDTADDAMQDRKAKPSPRERLAELNALGGEAIYVQADVSRPKEVAQLRDTVCARFDHLDGLIFGAGTVRDRAAVHEIANGDVYEANYEAKVHGLSNVLDVFGRDPLDFGIVLSSISTTLGGMGLCAYAAANHAADLLVFNHRRQGYETWVTSNWDIWGDGHLGDTDPRFSLLMTMSIQPDEGAQALEDILSLDLASSPQVIVSTHDLHERIDLWIKRTAMFATEGQVQHKRPNLSTEYLPAETELERQIAQVFSRVLGIDTVGREDDFFEMGGHSILAVQAAVQIQELAPANAPAINLYDAPNVRALAEALNEPDRAGVAPASPSRPQ